MNTDVVRMLWSVDVITTTADADGEAAAERIREILSKHWALAVNVDFIGTEPIEARLLR